ncbi:MAG: hypothetical protein ABIO24_00695 [Saprospiraceae bacterium]
MKASSFFGLTFLLLVCIKPQLQRPSHATTPLPIAWNEQALSGKKVYYFIEAQCAECSPAEGRATGKYVVITPGISTADYEQHPGLLDKFRSSLATQFPTAPGLRDGLVFSFHFTTAEADAMREAELEQKKAAGYEVLELELTQ